MIIVRITGGVGNQMFQYALAKHYQIKGKKTFLDGEVYRTSKSNSLRQYELHNFNLTIPETSDFFRDLFHSRSLLWRILRRTVFFWIKEVKQIGLGYDIIYTNQDGSVVLDGYFQSEKYFKSIREIIIKDFTFKSHLAKTNAVHLERIIKSNSVSIHIRRGDYVSDKLASKLLGALSLQYYKDAIFLIQQKIDNPTFFVFSDDQDWASGAMKEILKEFVLIGGNDGSDAWQDMFLMSHCKNNIIANSSFSWWGAWLNRNETKIVIAPAKWFNDSSVNISMEDLLPAEWIKI